MRIKFSENLFTLLIFLLLTIGTIEKIKGQVLLNKTKVSLDQRGNKTTEKTIKIRVNSKDENWLSHFEIRFKPFEDLDFHYARIIDAQGKVVKKLKNKDLSIHNDISRQAFFQDDQIAEADLYWNKFPYTVEYQYSISTDQFLYLTWWSPAIYSHVSTLNGVLELEIPKEYKINKHFTDGLKYSHYSDDKKEYYTWKSSYLIKDEQDLLSPPVQERLPQVQVVPDQFYYGEYGSTESWSSFGNWLYKLNEGTDKLPPDEASIIRELVGSETDTMNICRILYHYLQDHTRYINVAIEIGGMKSYPASYVSRNKYGDCKALTTYMKSLLNEFNIPSYYTIIHSGQENVQIIKDFPSQQFNHVILMVPLAKDTLWFENTASYLPFNYLGTFTQDRYALCVSEDSSNLIKTPALSQSEVHIQKKYTFKEDSLGEFSGSMEIQLRGEKFERFLYYKKLGDEEMQLKILKQELDIPEVKIRSWKTEKFSRDSTYTQFAIYFQCPRPLRKIAQFEVLKNINLSIHDLEEPEKRTQYLRLNSPISNSSFSFYHFKDLQEKTVEIPESVHYRSPFGYYKSYYEIKANSVFTEEELLLFAKEDINLEDYPEYYSFIEKIKNHQKRSAILLK